MNQSAHFGLVGGRRQLDDGAVAVHTIRLRGAVAELRWHTYPAAAVERYTIARTARGTVVVTGTVVLRDAFKLAQRPLTFAAPMLVGPPDRRLAVDVCWPIDTFTLSEAGALHATLGAQRRPSAVESLSRSVPGDPAAAGRR